MDGTNKVILNSDIGKRIHDIRINKNMTVKTLSEIVKVSPSYIYKIGSGKVLPGVSMLFDICKALDVLPNTIFGIENSDNDYLTKYSDIFEMILSLNPKQRKCLEAMARHIKDMTDRPAK